MAQKINNSQHSENPPNLQDFQGPLKIIQTVTTSMEITSQTACLEFLQGAL